MATVMMVIRTTRNIVTDDKRSCTDRIRIGRLFLEQLHRLAMGLIVDTHVGDLGEPQAGQYTIGVYMMEKHAPGSRDDTAGASESMRFSMLRLCDRNRLRV